MQQISVKLDNADIRTALQQLFKSANVNYTLDQSVKGTVTASLTEMPFRTALDMILRTASTPLTYRMEHGIYSILPRDQELVEDSQAHPLIVQLHPNNAVATTIVQKLKALPQFGPASGVTYQVNTGDNSILATTTNPTQYREIEEAVRLLDIAPREVSMKAEFVLMTGKGSKNNKAVVSMLGRTSSEGTVKLQTTTTGKSNSDSPIIVSDGDYNLTLKPTVNGDGSIQVEAEVNYDITYRLPGESHFQHLRNKFTGSGRYLSGDTTVLSSIVLKSKDGKSQQSDAELLIFLTPTLLQPRAPKQPTSGGIPSDPTSKNASFQQRSPKTHRNPND